ncbi:collagen-like protein [Haloactinopolyspora alba]|uniref:collagen-like protein n=1 Tax=Haloactinopolyspora alba TaxID=648780 RepID=UPI00101BEFB1|nr:collagen-like protein [Haloactinopolyspora alba]
MTGRFLQAVADGADLDSNPDGTPVTGFVTFTPSPTYVRYPVATPDPATIVPQAITCPIDQDGYLLDAQGNQGVMLVATDDPDGNPVDWTYEVRLDFGVLIDPFHINVPAGGEVDLTTLIPVSESDGVQTIQGPANVLSIGDVATSAPGTPAAVSVEGETPNQTLNFTLPRGQEGPPGTDGRDGSPGPANVLSIGTVASGTEPSATITGTSPSQTLNLVFEKGDTGATGPQGPEGPAGPAGEDGAPAERPVVDLPSGSTVNVDASTTGLVGRVTLAVDTTFTLTTPPSDGRERVVTLVLTQDATGGRTIALPASVLWAQGVPYTSGAPAGAVDVLHLLWDGAVWMAAVGAVGMATA